MKKTKKILILEALNDSDNGMTSRQLLNKIDEFATSYLLGVYLSQMATNDLISRGSKNECASCHHPISYYKIEERGRTKLKKYHSTNGIATHRQL